jgi:hypothetical protein
MVTRIAIEAIAIVPPKIRIDVKKFVNPSKTPIISPENKMIRYSLRFFFILITANVLYMIRDKRCAYVLAFGR